MNTNGIDVTKLSGQQLARAMHAARKVQLAVDADSQAWRDAAAVLQQLTAENSRRLGFTAPAAVMVVRRAAK